MARSPQELVDREMDERYVCGNFVFKTDIPVTSEVTKGLRLLYEGWEISVDGLGKQEKNRWEPTHWKITFCPVRIPDPKKWALPGRGKREFN